MLLVAILAYMAYAGWKRHTWATPFLGYIVGGPLVLFQIYQIDQWAYRVGASTHTPLGYAVELAWHLLLWVAAYWIGRGAVRIVRGPTIAPSA